MSALYLELARVLLFISSPLAPYGEVAKAPVVRLLVSVYSVVGLGLLATNLEDKHMATVLSKCVLVRRLQRLESLITDITRVIPLSCVLCPTSLIPSRSCMNSPKTELDIFKSRCQKMSTPLHVQILVLIAM